MSTQDADDTNKENTQTENIPQKAKLSDNLDKSRRLYQMSQKIRPIKKPPLPLINVNTKYVLCQKNFTVDFWVCLKINKFDAFNLYIKKCKFLNTLINCFLIICIFNHLYF